MSKSKTNSQSSGGISRKPIAGVEELRAEAKHIADHVNRDPALGILLLVDPARVLEEVGYDLTDELKRQVQHSMLGITRAQTDHYDEVRRKITKNGRIEGIKSVTLRTTEDWPGSGGEHCYSRFDQHIAFCLKKRNREMKGSYC
jgi:hypothetical protein